VDAGVAAVERDGVGSTGLANPGNALGGKGVGFVPVDLLEARGGAPKRPAQAVGIVLEIAQSHGLGADVAARERVALVPAQAGDAAALELHLDPTGGLAEGAGRVSGASAHSPRVT
jgi:hypothetical protein